MKRSSTSLRAGLALIFVLLGSLSAGAATKLRLHTTASEVAGYKAMDTQLGPLKVTAVTNSASSGTDIQVTTTAGGATLAWISDPIASGFALSGTVTGNPYTLESNGSANTSIRIRLYQYTGGSEGAAIATCQAAAEATTSITVKGCTVTPTSTVFAVGDRIVAKLFLENCSATSGCPTGTMAGSQTNTVDYDGATGAADGDTYIQLTESVTFGQGATPTFVAHVSGTNVGTNSSFKVSANGFYNMRTANVSLAGNLMVSACSWDDSATPTLSITDDKSQVWTKYVSAVMTGGQGAVIFGFPNTVSGVHLVPVKYTAATLDTACTVSEFKNIQTAAAWDGGSTNHTTGTTVSAGSITPGSTGDLFYQCALFGTNPGTVTAGSQSNITWALIPAGAGPLANANLVCQWGIYNSTAALNPQMTITNSVSYYTVAGAFKNATAGASHTGMYRQGVEHVDIVGGAASPMTVQFPSTGNLLVANLVGGGTTPGRRFTAISDSTGDTWHEVGTACQDGTNSSWSQLWYDANATSSTTRAITVTSTGTTSDGTILFYDVVGAATSPLDVDSGCLTGNQTSDANLTLGAITPTTANGLIIGNVSIDFNTVDTLSAPSAGLSDAFTYTGQVLSGPSDVDQNNGYFYYESPNTSSTTFTMTFIDDPTKSGAGHWTGRLTTFKAPAAGSVRKRVTVTSK